MEDKRHIAEILAERLQQIDDVGGADKFKLRETIGEKTYDRLLSKERTATLVDRWVNASSKAKPAATKALSVAIAKASNKPELLDRIENELSDAFDIEQPKKVAKRRETPKRAQKHAEAVRQTKNDQRPMPTDLAVLAKGDMSKYVAARRQGD